MSKPVCVSDCRDKYFTLFLSFSGPSRRRSEDVATLEPGGIVTTLTDDVLQYEVPADDEGYELSYAHVAVHVCRAGFGHARAELRVAETWGQDTIQK